MKYDLLFYKSRKTSYCEKAVSSRLAYCSMSANRIISSVAPQNLGTTLCQSLTLCNCVVIVGAFSKNDSENLITVLSRALSNSGLGMNNIRKLKGENAEGYIIKYNKQCVIALPDNPYDIENILSDSFLDYLSSLYN